MHPPRLPAKGILPTPVRPHQLGSHKSTQSDPGPRVRPPHLRVQFKSQGTPVLCSLATNMGVPITPPRVHQFSRRTQRTQENTFLPLPLILKGATGQQPHGRDAQARHGGGSGDGLHTRPGQVSWHLRVAPSPGAGSSHPPFTGLVFLGVSPSCSSGEGHPRHATYINTGE